MKSPPSLWQEILEQNKDDIVAALSELQSGIDDLIISIKQNQPNDARLEQLFSAAGRLPAALDS